jgi:hypothetical protein
VPAAGSTTHAAQPGYRAEEGSAPPRTGPRCHWTGLACPGHGLALGTDVDNAVLREMAAGSELADLTRQAPDHLTADHAQAFRDAMRARLAGHAERAGQLWENLRAIWSHAWSANYPVLEFMQGTGLSRFAPVKPQHWVTASFEHHTSPHGLPGPHVHNIVLTSLTTAAS